MNLIMPTQAITRANPYRSSRCPRAVMLEMISPVRAALLPVECVIVVVCAIVLLLHFYLFPNRCWGLCSLHRRACCGRRFHHRVVPTEPEILTAAMKLSCHVYHSLSIPFLNWNSRVIRAYRPRRIG